MSSTLFKSQKKILVEIANWLVKHGEPEAAKKVMFEIVKENPSNKSIRADYALMIRKIKDEKHLEQEEKTESEQNQIKP